nr:hypothetical protein [Mycobacteroides immunogenum]
MEVAGKANVNKTSWHGVVDLMIEAANNIPEGVPVGTIARRPDGEWIAVRREGYWGYRHLVGLSDDVAQLSSDDGADSWPVIYDPTKPEPKEYPYFTGMGDSIVLGPDCSADTERRVIWWEGRRYGLTPTAPDPTAQQEPEEGPPCETRGWLRQEFDKAEKRAAEIPDRARPKVVRGTIEDALRPDDVKLLETDPMEFVRRTSPEAAEELDMHPDAVYAREYAATDGFRDRLPKPHAPRVVDRLGVDEQGSRWRDANGFEWRWGSGNWWYYREQEWAVAFPDVAGPFREILEPRVLPSLDCEEARDGTVWTDSMGELEWHYRYTGQWECFSVTGSRIWRPLHGLIHLKVNGPYTEVLG